MPPPTWSTLGADVLRGSYPPLITPFRDGEVDLDTFAALVEQHVNAGSHGIVVAGTTGEPSVLSVDERKQLAHVAVKTAAGRLPVVVATGSQSLADTTELTQHATEIGADALLVVTPYYIRPPARGLVAYFAEIGRRSSLPLLLYHIPGRAAVGVDLPTLTEIAAAVPTFVGIKHAVADLGLVTDMLAAFGPDFRVLVGLEELSFPMLALGAAGMVNAVGNVAPALVSQLYESVSRGDLAAARALHFRLAELNQAIFYETNPIPLKYMMWRLGLLPSNEHRLPMVPASAEVAERLDGVLARAGLGPS
jgi:4-hydroxy-tetrahydrodipicolinate synthase